MTQINPILNQARQQSAAAAVQTATPSDISMELDKDTPKNSDSLKAVQDAINAATESSVAALEQSKKYVQESSTLFSIIRDSLAGVAKANQTIQLTKDNADLQAQNATIESFELGGGIDLQAQLSANLREESQRLDDLLDRRTDIMNDEHTNITIIDAVINEFRALQTDIEIEGAQAEVNATTARIRNSAAATEAFALQNSLTKKAINQATIEANQKKIAEEANLKLAEVELDTLNANSKMLAQVHSANQQQVQNMLAAYRLEGEAEQREIQKEKIAHSRLEMREQVKQWKESSKARAVALEQAELNLEKSKALSPTQQAQAELNLAKAQKDIQQQAATEDSLVQAVHNAQATLGVSVEPREVILFGLRSNKAKYNTLLDMGAVNAEDIKFGSSPAEAKETLATASPSGNFKETKITKLLDSIDSAMEIKFSTADATGQIPKRPRNQAEAMAAYNQVAEELMAAKASNIVAGDASNPYQAPAFTILESTAEVARTALYQKVLKAKGYKETVPQTIVDAALAGVISKEITIDQAAEGIEAIFDMAALINSRQDGGFRRIGLDNQISYNTFIKRPPSMFEELKASVSPRRSFEAFGLTEPKQEGVFPRAIESVNLMDRTQVRNILVQQMSARGTSSATPQQGDNN